MNNRTLVPFIVLLGLIGALTVAAFLGTDSLLLRIGSLLLLVLLLSAFGYRQLLTRLGGAKAPDGTFSPMLQDGPDVPSIEESWEEETWVESDDDAKNIDLDASRYLNAGFFSMDGARIPPEAAPALEQQTIALRVNISTAYWGIGEAVESFPDAVLQPHFETSPLPLTVAVDAPTLQVTPTTQTLLLPQFGNSPMLSFTVELTAPGRHTLSIDVLYAGHLLQSRQIALSVGEGGEPQSSRITFTRTAQLTPAELISLAKQPRPLTIIGERDPARGSIGLRIFDQSGGELAHRLTSLTDDSLTSGLDAVRGALYKMMTIYAKANDAPKQAQQMEALGELAVYGRALHQQLLRLRRSGPGYGAAAPDPGAMIQIAPLSERLSIPWEALYERPVHEYHPADSRLCDSYAAHGPQLEDCPHHANPYVVCPHGFWGFRYIIEQLPGRLKAGQPPTGRALPQRISNDLPTRLDGIVFPGFPGLAAHWQNLTQIAPEGMALQQLGGYPQIDAFFRDREARRELVYFYAHGGERNGRAFLKIADDRRISIGSLDAWGVEWEERPLLLLNACGSTRYDPDSFEDMIQEWFYRGAAGVIGTQCTIYESLVDALMPRFLRAFLRQEPAGEALYAARRELMWEQGDPRGLAYSLFAANELQLAQRVIG